MRAWKGLKRPWPQLLHSRKELSVDGARSFAAEYPPPARTVRHPRECFWPLAHSGLNSSWKTGQFRPGDGWPMMWGMTLHVFDHALADVQAAGNKQREA